MPNNVSQLNFGDGNGNRDIKDKAVRDGLTADVDYTGFDGPSGTATTPQDGDAWIYNATTHKWEPSDKVSKLINDLLDKQPKSVLLSAFRLSKDENYTTDASGNIVFPNSIDTNMVVALRVQSGNYIANIGYNHWMGYYAQITDYQGNPIPNINITIDVLYLSGVLAN